MNKAYLSLGTNRGNRTANLNSAINLLSEWVGNVITVSSIYETPPWKMVDKTDFLNQVLLLETTFSGVELLDTIILIESMMGRQRTTQKYEPRIIDIDILFFINGDKCHDADQSVSNNEIITTEELIVPHPLIQERRFILEPLAEIAAQFTHPVLKKSIVQLLNDCEDKSEIRKLIPK